jgi:hypothetical protein
MGECKPWYKTGDLLNDMMVCNNPDCPGPHQSGPSQPMVCDCCAKKLSKVPISYSVRTKTPVFACGHELRPGDFGFAMGHFGCCYDTSMKCPDCLGWKRPPPSKPRPRGDFTKFTMPVIRPQSQDQEPDRHCSQSDHPD